MEDFRFGEKLHLFSIFIFHFQFSIKYAVANLGAWSPILREHDASQVKSEKWRVKSEEWRGKEDFLLRRKSLIRIKCGSEFRGRGPQILREPSFPIANRTDALALVLTI